MICLQFPADISLPEELLTAMGDPALTAERVIELRDKYLSASGSTNPGCLSQMAENMEVKS